MRKFFIPVIAGFILAALYIVSGVQYTTVKVPQYIGDAEGVGDDDDPDARANYELMRLADPSGRVPGDMRQRELAFAATLPNDHDLAYARTTAGGVSAWRLPRGPWNVGGRTRALGIDVANENIIIAGSTSGSMWRSTDGGASWHMTSTPLQYKGATCLAQDTRHGHTNVWYYGTGEYEGASASQYGSWYIGNGIYKSVDGGLTWDTLHVTRLGHPTIQDQWGDYVWNIVTDSHDTTHDVVYAAVAGGIYRSMDGGATWTAVLSGFNAGALSNNVFTDVAISKSGVLYATLSDGAPAGVFRSTDGTTWTNITPAGFPTSLRRVKIGISPSDENQVYFLGNTPGFGLPYTNYLGSQEWNSLWKYNYLFGDGHDSCGVWRNFSRNLPNTGTLFDRYNCQGSYDIVVKVKPNDTNVVFIGGTNIYRSTTGFADSTHTVFFGGYQQGAHLPVVNMYLNHHPDQHELIFYPSNPNRMLSGNDGGVFYCNDNTVPYALWSSLNNGYLATMFYTCAIDHASTNDIIIGGAQDNGSWFTNSADLHAPWVTPRGGDGSFCAIADSGKAYYMSLQQGKTGKLQLDNAGRVLGFARIDPIGGKGYLFINPFVLDPNNNNIMYMAGGRALWRNNNLAGIPYYGNYDSISINWFKFPDSNLAPSGGNPQYISALAVSKTPANRLYVGTSNKRLYRIDSADIATRIRKEITWAKFPSMGSTWFGFISSIAVDPNNGDHVMVAFSNYQAYSLFYSSDGGTTWSRVAGNLEDKNSSTGAGDGPSVRWASIIPVNGGNVYMVGTTTGLYATTKLNDTNTVWVQQGTSTIGNSIIDMIDYRLTDGLVVVATHSGGMYSTHITNIGDITSVPSVPEKPQALNLTNYPNPFIAQTTIEFDLADRQQVSLLVFDQGGRLVRTLADGVLDAGRKRYLMNSEGLSPGFYYCVLKAGGSTETRTISLLR